MKALFLATLLILGAFATEDAVFAKLESSKQGRQILDTIQLQLESGDPADDLIGMLNDEESRIQDEQDIDDDMILPLQNQCVEDLAILVDEIAATRQRIQELNDLLTALRPIKEQKEEERLDLLDFKALLEEKIREIEAAKVEKDAEWAEEKQAHDSQTAIIQKVKDIIVGGLQTAFLQKQGSVNVLAQVASHLNQARKNHFKRKGMNSIMRVLAQVAASEDIQAAESSIQRIIDLCDQILDKIAESRAIEKDDYDHWVKEYTATHTALSAHLEETIAKILQLDIEIAVLAKRIAAAESELADQEVRLENKIVQHDERERYCDDEAKAYAKRREARSEQLDILSDAIGLLMSKIRMLKKMVSERTMSLERPVL